MIEEKGRGEKMDFDDLLEKLFNIFSLVSLTLITLTMLLFIGLFAYAVCAAV